MRIFWFISIFLVSAYASPIESFLASFTQTITSEQNDSVKYEGIVYFQKDRALWHYKKPSEKLIFIHPETVTVIEPPLEQAIISTHNEMQKMQSLLENWLTSGTKEINHDGIIYRVSFKDNLPEKIDYLDTLENRVSVQLNDVKTNESIPTEHFIPKIPEEYDILNY